MEDLKRKPGSGPPIESMLGSRAVHEFRDEFPANQEIHAILILFPREIDGEPTITSALKKAIVTIPLKERSLKGTFHPNRMEFQGRPTF